MTLPGMRATVTAGKVAFLLPLTRNSQDSGPPPLALTSQLSQWTSPRTRRDTAFPGPSGSRAVASKCPAREKEDVRGERAAPAPHSGERVLRHPAKQSLGTLPSPLQEPSLLKEGLPTHESSGEAGLSAAQALLETSMAPAQPLGSAAAAASHRPGPPGTGQRGLCPDTGSHGHAASLGWTLSAGQLCCLPGLPTPACNSGSERSSPQEPLPSFLRQGRRSRHVWSEAVLTSAQRRGPEASWARPEAHSQRLHQRRPVHSPRP